MWAPVLRADGNSQGHQVHASIRGQQADELLQRHGLPRLPRRRSLHCLSGCSGMLLVVVT